MEEICQYKIVVEIILMPLLYLDSYHSLEVNSLESTCYNDLPFSSVVTGELRLKWVLKYPNLGRYQRRSNFFRASQGTGYILHWQINGKQNICTKRVPFLFSRKQAVPTIDHSKVL